MRRVLTTCPIPSHVRVYVCRLVLPHPLSAQDILSQPKLGQSARYCWQYAVVNYASVVRLCEAHNSYFGHHPWKVDFEPFLSGKQCMINHLLLEETYAVSVLCGPREEGLTASGKAHSATRDFFNVCSTFGPAVRL